MLKVWRLGQDPVPEATLQGPTYTHSSAVWGSVSILSYVNRFVFLLCVHIEDLPVIAWKYFRGALRNI